MFMYGHGRKTRVLHRGPTICTAPIHSHRSSTVQLDLLKVTLGLRISAGHLPGASNALADVGLRAWTSPYNESGLTLLLHGYRTESPTKYGTSTKRSLGTTSKITCRRQSQKVLWNVERMDMLVQRTRLLT